jgi:hypothetical protein
MIVSPFTMKPVTSQVTHAMTRDKLNRFLEFESLLRDCGWQLVCARCTQMHGPGKDGVRGDNEPTGTEYRVECGCSVHVFTVR